MALRREQGEIGDTIQTVTATVVVSPCQGGPADTVDTDEFYNRVHDAMETLRQRGEDPTRALLDSLMIRAPSVVWSKIAEDLDDAVSGDVDGQSKIQLH